MTIDYNNIFQENIAEKSEVHSDSSGGQIIKFIFNKVWFMAFLIMKF